MGYRFEKLDSLIKTDKENPDACWKWLGAHSRGYGNFYPYTNSKVVVRAHRAVYEELVGSIPDGMDLHHKCGNRGCVNPSHLEPVSRSVNIKKSWDGRRRRDVLKQIRNLSS